ncbi:hypothetical protein AAC387_Pa06g1191 [Persea americana]
MISCWQCLKEQHQRGYQSEQIQQKDPVALSLSIVCFLCYNAATTHVGGTDSVIQHSAEVSSATPFPSTAAALDVHVMENTPLMKDSGAVVQTLPATSATERLGSGISDPSLTTGDALD